MKYSTNLNKIAMAILVTSMTYGVHAQLNVLKGAKDKINEKTSSSEKSNSGTNVVGPPAYDPDSPTYRAYSIVRDEIKSVQFILRPENWGKNPEGRNEEAVRYLAKAKENLIVLQSDPIESKKPYVKDLATSLEEVDAERATKIGNFNTDKEYDEKLDSYHKFAMNGWGINDKSLEPSYMGYYAFRKDFETKRPEKFKDSYVQSRATDIDNYFKVEVYKIIPELDAEVDKIIKETHAKNSSGDEDYLLNAKHYQSDFVEPLETIAYNKKFLMEDHSGIDVVLAKIQKEKAMLDEYINSGKCEAHRAKFKQAMIDAVRVAPSKTSNASYESMAKSGVKKGTVKRISITSSVWTVKKNEWGLPMYKYLPVDLAVEHEGKCYLAYGQIRKEYEGAGTYGGEYFSYWDFQEEMNCANINK